MSSEARASQRRPKAEAFGGSSRACVVSEDIAGSFGNIRAQMCPTAHAEVVALLGPQQRRSAITGSSDAVVIPD